MAMNKVVAMYNFFEIQDPIVIRDFLDRLTEKHSIQGGFIIANEGINGTISGSCIDMDSFLEALFAEKSLFREKKDSFEIKYSYANINPFYRMRLKISSEIITFFNAIDGSNGNMNNRGIYVSPKDWNNLIVDPDVTVIDTRNSYEVEIGRFKNAIDPNTKKFADLPGFLSTNLDKKKNKKIAMYCTGGIRCEKSCAYLLSQGFEEVYSLKGGILKYLEEIPEENSLWSGDCYVFDQRISVGHQLKITGNYTLCRSCRHPLNKYEQDELNHYIDGVQCVYCYNSISESKKQKNIERHKQLMINPSHLGLKYAPHIKKKKHQHDDDNNSN